MYFDGHSDLIYDATRWRLAGETHVLEQRHLHHLRGGDVEGMVLSLWSNATKDTFWGTDPRGADSVWRQEQMLCALEAELRESPWLKLVRTAAEAEAARREGKIYAFFGIEGMESIGTDLDQIDRYADLGARMAMLTWNEENLLAAGAKADPQQGLTALGRAAVKRMQRRGIILDVSHLNDAGFWDSIRMAQGAVIASHSNCRALCDVRRNLTDEQLRAIRDTGGTVGLNVHHAFVHEEPAKQTAYMLACHAAHMAEVMGPEYVACGFDFCEYMGPGNEGVDGMENCSQIQNLFFELERVGFSTKEREGIAKENLLRILR